MAAYIIKHSGGTMSLSASSEKEAKTKAESRGAVNITEIKKTTK